MEIQVCLNDQQMFQGSDQAESCETCWKYDARSFVYKINTNTCPMASFSGQPGYCVNRQQKNITIVDFNKEMTEF